MIIKNSPNMNCTPKSRHESVYFFDGHEKVGYNNLTNKLISKHMSKRIFNEDQIKELLANPNVSRCSEKSITYGKAFKILAIKKYYEEGYLSLIHISEPTRPY